MARVFEIGFDAPKTYYRAAGEVICRASLFEHHIMVAIAAILKITNKKQRRIAFMGMGIKPKLGVLKALSTHWSPTPEVKKEIHAIIKAALDLINWRNRIAHGIWVSAQGRARDVFLYYADEGKDFYLPKADKVSSRDMHALGAEYRALTKRLWIVCKALKAD